MWTCRCCENSNVDWLEKCECCGATRPVVDYVPKPMLVEKPQPKPTPKKKERPVHPPKPKPPLDIVAEGEMVDLSKAGHVYITEDGKVGVPKKTKPEPKVKEPAKKEEPKTTKKRIKKRAKISIYDFEQIKAFYYLFSIVLALLVIVLMCVENINILWIIIALFGPVTYFVMLFKE